MLLPLLTASRALIGAADLRRDAADAGPAAEGDSSMPGMAYDGWGHVVGGIASGSSQSLGGIVGAALWLRLAPTASLQTDVPVLLGDLKRASKALAAAGFAVVIADTGGAWSLWCVPLPGSLSSAGGDPSACADVARAIPPPKRQLERGDLRDEATDTAVLPAAGAVSARRQAATPPRCAAREQRVAALHAELRRQQFPAAPCAQRRLLAFPYAHESAVHGFAAMFQFLASALLVAREAGRTLVEIVPGGPEHDAWPRAPGAACGGELFGCHFEALSSCGFRPGYVGHVAALPVLNTTHPSAQADPIVVMPSLENSVALLQRLTSGA